MKVVRLRNFRSGLSTNSSSTHSVIYRNEGEMFEDLDVFELDYYDRCDSTIAATREAKIKYILANIMYDDTLVKALLPKYPEMKQYFGKIKKKFSSNDENDYNYDESFGMYCRGELFTGNLAFDLEYISEIIDNPDLIIIGGSDELDFVYDTCEGHAELVEPHDFEDFGDRYVGWGNKGKHIHKNGNYWVAYGSSRLRKVTGEDRDYDFMTAYKKHSTLGRVRFSTTKGELIPKYPELIDLRITNKCNHGCPFCFMDSTNSEPHMDASYIYRVLNGCGPNTEFSIGGGNILLYPDLEEVLGKIKSEGHIVNVTINAKDCDTIVNDEKFKDIFMKYVDGVGISVTKVEDVSEVKKFHDVFSGNNGDFFRKHPGYRSKYITMHMIPELLGVQLTKDIMNEATEQKMWITSLFLGYKTNGRGAKCEHVVFSDDELNALFNDVHYRVAIDTSFANSYYKWLDENFAISKCITLNEGEFSIYVDGVNQVLYKSSYQLDKPYRLYEWNDKEIKANPFKARAIEVNDVMGAFACVRKDNGLKVYSDAIEDKYYADAEIPYYEDEYED